MMEYLSSALTLLLAPTTLLALLLYTLLTFAVEWSGTWLTHRWDGGSPLLWATEHLYIPWLNLLALALFITALEPQIFGLAVLPEAHLPLKRLADITLFISIILPLLPIIGRAEFALPVQGIIIVTLIFRGLGTTTNGGEIEYWPGVPLMLLMGAISLGTLFLSRISAGYLGEWLDGHLERRGFERALQHGIQLALQSPVIFIYAMGLGAQLPGQ